MSSNPMIAPHAVNGLPLVPNNEPVKAPPHPLDTTWHVHIGEQTYGPYTGHQIKEYIGEGRILPSSQILPIGSETWIRAADDARIGALFRDHAKVAAPPITAATGATVVQVTNQISTPNMLAGFELANAKSPGIALLLSFLFCGVGQMYNGQVGKGIMMLIGCVVLWVIFLGWTISIWSMIDAYQTAQRMNLQHARQVAAGMSA